MTHGRCNIQFEGRVEGGPIRITIGEVREEGENMVPAITSELVATKADLSKNFPVLSFKDPKLQMKTLA